MSSVLPSRVNPSPKVYLSYALEDADKVTELYERLSADGFQVWMDRMNLRPGSRWEEEILRAIEETEAVVVCISRYSLKPGYKQREIANILEAARAKSNVLIIPARLEDSAIPKELRIFQAVDLFVPAGYERLRNALGSVLSEKNRRRAEPRMSRQAEARAQRQLDEEASRRLEEVKSEVEAAQSRVESQNQTSSSVEAKGDAEVESKPIPTSTSDDEQVTEDEDLPLQADAGDASQSVKRTKRLRRGSSGEDVRALQEALKSFGFDLSVDGKFGPDTHKAVVAFQQENALNADGIVGPDTFAALDAELADHQVGEVAPPPPAPTSKEGLAEEARERNALNDKPIDDVEADTLGFRDYVFALRDFIASQSTTTPLTISINGAWGSGKSSLMQMLRRQLEPELKHGLWWIQIKWLAGWLWGSFFWAVGKALIKLKHADSGYIQLGFAFEPEVDVTNDNFEHLFGKYVDYSLTQDIVTEDGKPIVPERLKSERALRANKTRFWARQAARRRKMTPLKHPTVWFNAWKFNQQEQVWSALATAVLGQLTTKYGFFSRLFFLAQLTWKRTDKFATLNQIARKLIIPVAIGAVVALYRINRDSLRAYLPIPSVGGSSWLSSDTIVWLAPMLAAMWQAFKAIKDPFKLPLDELVTQPDYKGKIGFIGTFEEDFGRIVELAIRKSIFWKPRKLIIFIDDLDRCSPIQAAGIVEAVNLFLDSVGCVFVLGMDMSAVAISIEVKYKELTARMRADAPDSISPGILFLDKIVQVPFNVPRPNRRLIESLVKKITEPESRKLPPVRASFEDLMGWGNGEATTNLELTSGERQVAYHVGSSSQDTATAPQPDRAGFAQKDVREAIAFGATLLKENPRQVKRFINLFRLQVYIAHERGLLSDGNEFGLTPRKLAVWVAWYMQWPDLLKLLAGPADSGELRKHLVEISEADLPGGGYTPYVKNLKHLRLSHSDEVTHWTRLPWPLWILDGDFLQCLKELKVYWTQPLLLESILDMTQATVNPVPTPAIIPGSLGASADPDLSSTLSPLAHDNR